MGAPRWRPRTHKETDVYIDPMLGFLLLAGGLIWLISILISMHNIANASPGYSARLHRIHKETRLMAKTNMNYDEVYNALLNGVGKTGFAELRRDKELYLKKEENADWILAGTVTNPDEAQGAIDAYFRV
jgi:hypothetical protein